MYSFAFIGELLKKGKRCAVSYIVADYQLNKEPESSVLLHHVAEYLLNPTEKINKTDVIEWIRWLIGAGKNPDEFSKEVAKYDTATTCGLVWIANFVAYRCRTCAISPCMSLCAECFQKGEHDGHDFNMFRSLSGGACDCGDESVMKKSGFCCKHSYDRKSKPDDPTSTSSSSLTDLSELLLIAKGLMPKIINRLLVELRRNDIQALNEIDVYLTNLLSPLTSMGAPMRTIISKVLLDPKIYQKYAKNCETISGLERKNFLMGRYEQYVVARMKMPNFNLKNYYKGCSICPPNQCTLKLDNNEFNHNTFVEELLFWTIQYEFPQKLVCFLLNMLRDSEYKQTFARSFVYHYSRISMMLANFNNDDSINTNKPTAHDLLSNCVVHVSVQLLSNESLAFKLCEEEHLLFIIIASLKATIEGSDLNCSNLTNSQLQDVDRNQHKVVKCDHQVMKKHFYWPLVSDLNNILTHRRVALMFIKNKEIFELWLGFILDFQGMNLNTRELAVHVEFENDSYYASFSSELEICATSLWTIMLHNKEISTAPLTKQVISSTLNYLNEWFRLIGFSYDLTPNPLHCTFHIPLHRYYSIFLRNGVEYQNLNLDELLPLKQEQIKLLLAHPLQIQVNFYEILCTLWVRNGLQMKGQAMTYIQCHFCNSMIDPDLFLIQQLASKLSPDWFIQTVLERFHVYDWLSFRNNSDNFVFNFNNLYSNFNSSNENQSSTSTSSIKNNFLEPEQLMPMIEGALTFLCTLFTIQTNLGLTEEEIIRKEMVTLLCMADRTYSQLHDLLPEKCGTSNNKKCFDKNLAEIADFRPPALEAGGNVSQGMFYPKPYIWLNEYDPLYVLLRAVHRRDYQSSFDRFTQFIKSNSKDISDNPSKKQDSDLDDKTKQRNKQLWPPFRLPLNISSKFADPKKLLYSKVLHGFIFTILYRALYTNDVSEQVLALTMFLLQLSLVNNKPDDNSPGVTLNSVEFTEEEVNDLAFEEWFGSNWVLENMNIIVQDVVVYERRQNSKNNSCILFGSDKSDHFHNQADKNLEDQGLSVEEMEVDFLFPNDDSGNRYNEDLYMNDVENLMNERREFIERIEEMPQLPSSNVPLALTSGNLTSDSSTGSSSPLTSGNQLTQQQQLTNIETPNVIVQSDDSLTAVPVPSTSSSSSNSLSSSSSAPLLAILSASATSSATETNTSNTPVSKTPLNNTQTVSLIDSNNQQLNPSSTNNLSTLSTPNEQQQQSLTTDAYRMARRNLHLNTLSIQNLSQARSNNNSNQLNSNYVSGPSTSPQTRAIILEVPKMDANNWVNSFTSNVFTSNNSIVPANQNNSISPTLDCMPSSSSNSNAATTSSNAPSLPFLRRFHSQNRRSKYNRKRCPLEFNKQYHATENQQMSIYELLGNNQSGSNLIKRKITINESLISLLLKLHSKFNNKQDSYEFDKNRANDINNRIGDATHFIQQVLDLYCNLNASTGRQAIQKWKIKLWPFNYAKQEQNLDSTTTFNLNTQHPANSPSSNSTSNIMDTDSPTSNLDKEERRRKAKERQQKLMAEFANKQKAFMKQMNEEFPNSNQDSDRVETMTVDICNKIQYECVICGQTTPSTPERLVGMVVLLQSSSILAHCKPKYPIETLKKTRSLNETEKAHEGRTQLIDEETVLLNKKQTLGNYMEERIDLLDRNFNKSSWFNAINLGWDGGVHIQSCGHYLHLDCHCSYMQSLKASRLRSRNNSDNGEFSCPLCRQMGNSVLPINPDLNKKANLKNYNQQIRQFNLKKQDFSSVNKHVAKMFELLAFNSSNNNQNDDDEESMNDNEETNNETIRENQTNRDNVTYQTNENISIETTTATSRQMTNETENITKDVEFKSDSNLPSSNECTVDSPNPTKTRFFSSSSTSNSPKSSISSEDLHKETCIELINLYTRIPTPDSNLLKSFGFFCEDLTKATGPQYRSVKTSPTPHALYLFMCSILRTNLETELLVKLSKSSATGAKKSCSVSLFHVLALNCHFLIPQYYTSLWSQLTGLTVPDDFRESIIQVDKEVPLLLVDTCAILIQLLFALPLNVDEKYYDSIVQNLYNLTAIQSLSQITCFFSEDERSSIIKQQINKDQLFECPSTMINYILTYYEEKNSNLYSCMDEDSADMSNKKWKTTELRDLAIIMCLPFVRMATLLKCYLYNLEYPSFTKLTEDQFKKAEYLNLIRVLNLKNSDKIEDAFLMPHFVCDEPIKLLNIWLNQYSIFLDKTLIDAIKLLHFKPINFISPKLLNLPPTYDQLFLHYYQKPCSNCNTCPKEPCICFLCASLVCMRQECCRKTDGSAALEAAYHSQICGAGTALYLAVYSSTVIVIRGRRACVWGSVYLDTHGEEDRDLKRGRPLYLSELRYKVLEQQWLTHSFDHTNKRFVLHKDMI